MPTAASREDKDSMRTAVQVAFVKVKDVFRRISVKSFSVTETLRALMRFPIVVGFRACRIPVIENFKVGVILSNLICKNGDTFIS